jgi:hypothetical protein
MVETTWRLGQRLAFHALHYEVVDAILLADVVQRADVGMVEGGDGSCLAFEPLPVHRIVGELREDLDGDSALEPCISRTVNLSHSAHTEHGENLVGSQTRSRGQYHIGANYTRANPSKTLMENVLRNSI